MKTPCLVMAAAVLFAGWAAAVGLSASPHSAQSVDIFGQPSRSAEVAGRPLGQTLAVFRSSRLAAKLPSATGLLAMKPLAFIASHLLGKPGRLVMTKTRVVDTPATGPVYLVPTVSGWVCVQGSRFETCDRGLLRQGITWNFYSTSTSLEVIGIAADNVARVSLIYGTHRRVATLHDNFFSVARPITLTSAQHLPPLGRLLITYRGHSRPPSETRFG